MVNARADLRTTGQNHHAIPKDLEAFENWNSGNRTPRQRAREIQRSDETLPAMH